MRLVQFLLKLYLNVILVDLPVRAVFLEEGLIGAVRVDLPCPSEIERIGVFGVQAA